MSIAIEIWGNNIWYLFHTLSYKIKEGSFLILKNDLIEIFKNICKNLPCPDCSKDAMNVIGKIDFNNINTKEDFKLMLFNFHNYVNRKLKKKEFKYEDFDNKYKNANIISLIHNFNIIFNSKASNPHMISNTFLRKQELPKINILLNKVIQHIN
tara:strand:- start:366 stop:827 length:462 start_codon:yes stop_codon:yes gene_type:complete